MEGGDVVFLGGENLIGEVDWSNIFDDDLHGGANVLDWGEPAVIADSYASPSDAFSNNSPDSVSSWIDGIEKLLMEDDDESKVSPDSSSDYCETFLADLLVNSPANMSDEVPAPAFSTDSDPNVSADANANSEEEEEVDEKEKEKEKVEAAEVEDDADDPISKKRRRQLRNRDAAVRSRERKKIYVKDLEMKSKYLEGECRRLGRLLQCCYAENQALRVTMQMSGAFGASTTKQESAVLLILEFHETADPGSKIPAVGFPALVGGPHVPVHAAGKPSTNFGSGSSGRTQGKESSRKSGSKRSRRDK
ncbi:hypothetical protein TIFTF001_004815 [Ficus carica]|uniref:BZIP domain-containing protein n=1 Tax=Ficus carica TaxID=3494 RepID=A0AA87ZZJ7_FICCA|nr:hypothetical protein TIFTF001_004815 [Ficus carica]